MIGEQRIPFTREDEERIASAGVWGVIVGVASIVSTLVSTAVSALTLGATGVVIGVIGLAITIIPATWLIQASGSFRKVALTDEADEHHLLEGFRKLRNYFMMIGILIIVVLSLAALAFVGLMTCGSLLRRW